MSTDFAAAFKKRRELRALDTAAAVAATPPPLPDLVPIEEPPRRRLRVGGEVTANNLRALIEQAKSEMSGFDFSSFSREAITIDGFHDEGTPAVYMNSRTFVRSEFKGYRHIDFVYLRRTQTNPYSGAITSRFYAGVYKQDNTLAPGHLRVPRTWGPDEAIFTWTLAKGSLGLKVSRLIRDVVLSNHPIFEGDVPADLLARSLLEAHYKGTHIVNVGDVVFSDERGDVKVLALYGIVRVSFALATFSENHLDVNCFFADSVAAWDSKIDRLALSNLPPSAQAFAPLLQIKPLPVLQRTPAAGFFDLLAGLANFKDLSASCHELFTRYIRVDGGI